MNAEVRMKNEEVKMAREARKIVSAFSLLPFAF